MVDLFRNKTLRIDVGIGIFAIAVFIVLTIFMGNENSVNNPEYSVLNYGKKGSSLLYEGLKEMGYPISISYTMINKEKSIHDIYIVIEPEDKYNDYSKMLEWVKNGGRLILFSSTYPYYDENGKVKENNITTGDVFSYNIGLGQIYAIQSIYALNETMATNRIGGNYVTNKLNEWGKSNIYVNEFYHGFSGEYNIWKSFSVQTKLIVVQVIIIVVAIIFYLGKRFGNITPYYEEIERSEDEHLEALANLYLYAKDGSVPINSYYNLFLAKSSRYFNIPRSSLELVLIDNWKNSGLNNIDILIWIVAQINIINSSNEKFRDMKKTSEIVKNINILYNSF